MQYLCILRLIVGMRDEERKRYIKERTFHNAAIKLQSSYARYTIKLIRRPIAKNRLWQPKYKVQTMI